MHQKSGPASHRAVASSTRRATGNRAVYNAEAMSNVKWIAGRRGGIALGVVLSFAAGGAYLAGLLDGLNNVGLDLHFRYLGDVPADPRIVLIDIDDQSLAALADWPWPRRLYADLVNTLHELGTKTIALDVILPEPTAPRVEHAGLERDYDLDTELSELGDRASDQPIYDDDELRDAIQDANVYLSMYAPLTPPGHVPAHVLQLALEIVRVQPGISPDQLSGSIDLPPGWSAERLLTQARIALLLEADFTLDDAAVTAALGGDSTQTNRLVRENFAAAKRLAAEHAARRFFQDHSAPVWREFVASTMPGRMPDELSADRKCLIDAFRAERSRRVITNMAPGISAKLAGYVQHTYDAAYPLDKFAEASGGIGFVAFGREKSDGVLRSVPMVVDVEYSPVPQLGLLVAMKLLGADTPFRYENGELIVETADRPLRIPIDGEGRTLINWHVPKTAGGHRDWRNSFNHIPAAVVLEIPGNRRTMADNDRRLALAKAELLQTRHAETVAEFARYADLIRKRVELKARSGGPGRKTWGPAMAAPAMPESESSELQSIEGPIREMEEEAIVWLQRAENLWRNEQPRDDAEVAERAGIFRLYEWFNEDRLASRIAESNRFLEARNTELRKELLARIGGKLCLVGYTASGVADLVTTPIHSQAPGVIAHANIINMVLQNRFLSRPSLKYDFTFVVLAGVAAMVAACAGGWRFSLAGFLVTGGVLVAIGAAAFRLTSIHTASFPAAAAIAGVWGGVTLYRQSTEERARRRLHCALTQYTSPAIAAQIAERFDREALAPQAATVTCFFSDLRGFTQLSERLGPERTRNVLNPYLESISRILLERGAMVNKFIGDGIFAFFNAPIRVCSDHARAACDAALASRDALLWLNQRLSRELGGEPLAMRIGISTGEAFVGDYGSEMKLDYTCIGDTVNLGSRLEQANKSLGTSILVDDRTRQAAGEGFVFRPIGLIAVAGRSAPAYVHELADQPRTADPGFAEFCSLSARTIAYYQACEWDLCLSALAECRALRPDDRVLALYARSVETLQRTGRPSHWEGALQIGAAESGPV